MASLQDLVKQVSIDLNDYAAGHEFTTWTEEQLSAYVIEGLQVAFTFRPELFMRSVVVELTAGNSIQRPCDCTKIRRVYGISTKEGRLLYGLRKRKASDKLQWYGKTCPVDPKYWKGRDYYIDSEGDTIFIEPAPPVGQKTYALIECATAPTADNVGDIPVELQAPAVQWALYRAKMVDGENNATIYQVANAHKQTCFDLLRVQLQLNDSLEVDRTAPNQANVRVADNG